MLEKLRNNIENNLSIQYVSVKDDPVKDDPVDNQSNQDAKKYVWSSDGKDFNDRLSNKMVKREKKRQNSSTGNISISLIQLAYHGLIY